MLFWRFLGVVCSVISYFLDQYSKNSILAYFDYKTHKALKINEFLDFTLVWNRGISFGMFSNLKNPRVFLLFMSISIVLFLVYLFFKEKKPGLILSIGTVIGAAFGNIYDRYNYGKVVDFIDVHYKNYYWPTFNIADSLIFLAVSYLLLAECKIFNKNKNI